MQPEEKRNYLMRWEVIIREWRAWADRLTIWELHIIVKGRKTENLNYMNIHVVYTKRSRNNRISILKNFAHPWTKNTITVATSDGFRGSRPHRGPAAVYFLPRIKETMKKQKHRSGEQNVWRIRKMKTYMMDGISLEKEQPEKKN